MLLVSRSGVPSGKQCLAHFHTVMFSRCCFSFFFACVCSYNTDALTLVHSCHDLVYFCSQRVAFMYVFFPVEVECPLIYMNMV